MKKIKISTLAIIYLLLVVIANQFNWWTDNSDRDGWHRSGLAVCVDAATGVNYVKAGWFGGTCVRVNADGTPFITPQATTR